MQQLRPEKKAPIIIDISRAGAIWLIGAMGMANNTGMSARGVSTEMSSG
jgi:hypothetical protein